MIYDSFDTIPFKLFIKVTQSNDLTLLSDTTQTPEVLLKAWEKINEEFKALDPNKTIEKTFKILKEVEEYRAQYNFIQFAVNALKQPFDRDLDLENNIRELGFKLRESSFYHDLEIIEMESKALLVFIEEGESKLPKVDNKPANSIDKVILGYASFTGLPFTDTNKITGTQYYGLKEIFDEKLKVLKDQKAKTTKK